MTFDNFTLCWLVGLGLLLLGFSVAGVLAMRSEASIKSQKFFWTGLLAFHLLLAVFLFRFSPWLALVPLLPLGAFIPLLWTLRQHQQALAKQQNQTNEEDEKKDRGSS